jgi:hypothetical protein
MKTGVNKVDKINKLRNEVIPERRIDGIIEALIKYVARRVRMRA